MGAGKRYELRPSSATQVTMAVKGASGGSTLEGAPVGSSHVTGFGRVLPVLLQRFDLFRDENGVVDPVPPDRVDRHVCQSG
jgi:hypothetical protein